MLKLNRAFYVTLVALISSVAASAQAAGPAAPKVPAQFTVKEVALPFDGRLFVPDDGKAHPGVLYLHGSEGGIDFALEAVAKDLASRGFSTLALCWFGCGDHSFRPKAIDEIDLSYTYDAWNWFRNSAYVQDHRTALYGISRGAEHALLLMTYLVERFPNLPRPDALALHAPFDQILPPFSSNFQNGFAYQWKSSHDGLASYTAIPIAMVGKPISVSHGLIDGLSDPNQSYKFQDDLQKAGIPFSRDTRFVSGSDCKNQKQTVPTRADIQAPDARVEFHHFECEMHIFSQAADPVRLSLLEAFLKKSF